MRQDSDDSERLVGASPRMHVLRGPRHGYEGLHLYYNEMAETARGSYLLLWNDDARMLTSHWDSRIEELDPDRPFVATLGGADHPFPVVSRAFYRTLGHFSLAPHCDTWVCEVAKAAGCMVNVDIAITHLRDELDDETKRDGDRAQREVTLPLMALPKTQALLEADIEKLRAALGVAA